MVDTALTLFAIQHLQTSLHANRHNQTVVHSAHQSACSTTTYFRCIEPSSSCPATAKSSDCPSVSVLHSPHRPRCLAPPLIHALSPLCYRQIPLSLISLKSVIIIAVGLCATIFVPSSMPCTEEVEQAASCFCGAMSSVMRLTLPSTRATLSHRLPICLHTYDICIHRST